MELLFIRSIDGTEDDGGGFLILYISGFGIYSINLTLRHNAITITISLPSKSKLMLCLIEKTN